MNTETNTANDRPDIPLGYTYDENGNVLTFKDSAGNWYELAYDKHGYLLSFKGSTGYCVKYTRDERGKLLAHEEGILEHTNT